MLTQEAITNCSIVGTIASVIGVPLTIGGFIIAFIQLRRTRKASESAVKAVKSFREDLSQTICISDLTKALVGIDELKRLIRNRTYTILPDRLADVRHTLIAVRGSSVDFSKEDQISFQETIAELSSFEIKIEEYASSNSTQKIKRATESLIKRTDDLHELMSRLKNKIGGKNDTAN